MSARRRDSPSRRRRCWPTCALPNCASTAAGPPPYACCPRRCGSPWPTSRPATASAAASVHSRPCCDACAVNVPPSLRHRDLAPVWQRAAARLARSGPDARGAVTIPPLEGPAQVALRSLLRLPTVGRRVDLAALEAALRRHGVGDDLPAALAALGAPVPVDVIERRAARRSGEQARLAFREAVAGWSEPVAEWTAGWAEAIARAGLLAGLDA